MFIPTIIVDEFADIVAKVSSNLTPSLKAIKGDITGVHYMHGHPIEIAQTLTEKSETNEFKFKKYPLIALLQDFPETKGDVDTESEFDAHIIICMGTDPNYKASKRYDINFRPILYPIYADLLNEISKHKKFVSFGQQTIKHTKIDRLFWGVAAEYGNTKSIFCDNLDVIEVKNLKIKVKLKYC